MLANLNSVLFPAQEGKYAVGLFNTTNLELARGVIAAAEELRAPVIIGTAEILLPYGPLEDLAYLLLPMAERATVPVVVHLDHGLKEETCKKALSLGFKSIMYDCSTEDYETNVRKVAEMTELAHAYGATLEAELGHVGDNDGSNADPSLFYTQPEQAKDFIARTGADALAIAVGTAHGAYKLPPKLDFQRIEEIAAAIDTPLVLHGGSGLSDEDFRQAIRRGICKVNIFTDINNAAAKAMHDHYAPGLGITDLVNHSVEAVKNEVIKKMRLFGCDGKA